MVANENAAFIGERGVLEGFAGYRFGALCQRLAALHLARAACSFL